MPITATVVNPIVATIDMSIQYLPYMIIAQSELEPGTSMIGTEAL